jgi:hypothetical protein
VNRAPGCDRRTESEEKNSREKKILERAGLPDTRTKTDVNELTGLLNFGAPLHDWLLKVDCLQRKRLQ